MYVCDQMTRQGLACVVLLCVGVCLVATEGIDPPFDPHKELEAATVRQDDSLIEVKGDLGIDSAVVGVNTEDGVASAGSVSNKEHVLPFFHGFVASLSVIIVSELGDKTFFIAAILAMQHSRLIVFAGSILSLTFMHTLSVLLGFAAIIVPRWITFYLGALLFAIFGLKMLWEGWNMSPEEGQEEFDEVSETLKKKEEETASSDPEQGELSSNPPLRRRIWLLRLLPPIFFQAFTLTFIAEWGDRSQIAAIILAARENPYGVLLGGAIGHAICTGVAIIGGTLIAKKISVKTVTILGGIVFLLFALTALFQDPNAEVKV